MSLINTLLTEKVKRADRPDAYKTSNDILFDYYDQNKEVVRSDPDREIYVHFSAVKKVGINPQSGFTTPIGFYGYPLVSMVDDLTKKSVDKRDTVNKDRVIPSSWFPYRQREDYITIYRLKKGANVLYMEDSMDIETQKSYLDALEKSGALPAKKFKQLYDSFGFDKIEKRKQEVGDAINSGLLGAKHEEELRALIKDTELLKVHQFVFLVKWIIEESRKYKLVSKLFLAMGIDGLSDHEGGKHIHPSEPFQMVTFRTGAIEVLDVIENTTSRETTASSRTEKRDLFTKRKQYVIGIVKSHPRSKLQGRPFYEPLLPYLTDARIEYIKLRGLEMEVVSSANYVFPILMRKPLIGSDFRRNNDGAFLQGIVIDIPLPYYNKADEALQFIADG
jgi:hypothetical protein